MSVNYGLAGELERIIDAMIEAHNDPQDIADCCKDAIIDSVIAHGGKKPELK